MFLICFIEIIKTHLLSTYFRISTIRSANPLNQSSLCPLVVSAEVPILMPDVSINDRGSFGTPFLLTVIPFY